MAFPDSNYNVSVSLSDSSDEVLNFYCQPCDVDNIHVEAISYCVDCCEYLCDICSKCHGKFLVTRHHTLLDQTSMPKTNMPQMINDILTERCPVHTDKVIEYLCNDHDKLCCNVCSNMNHRDCSMSYILELSTGIADSQEFHKLQAALNAFIAMAAGHKQHIENGILDIEKYRSKALADIKQFRENMMQLIEKLEQDALKKVSQLNDENKENLQKASERCQSLLATARQKSSGLDESIKQGKHNQLFIDIKSSNNCISSLMNEFNEVKKFKLSHYLFHQDGKLQELLSTLSSTLTLSERTEATVTRARFIRDINVISLDDTLDSEISGLTLLPGGRSVLTDLSNQSIKLVDMKQNKVISCLSLTSKPYDTTAVNYDQVAVTLPAEKKIQIFSVANSLYQSKLIDVPGCKIVGLRHDGNTFIAACLHPSTIKMIDMSGNVLRTFDTDSQGKPLFTTPTRIAINHDHNVLYVTDCKANAVTCMTLDGKVISVYRHAKLKSPKGIAVDTDGSVYVCSSESNTVHQLTPTGSLIKILLGQDDKLVEIPLAMEYSDMDYKLYISSNSFKPEFCNCVRVFQLE